MEYNDRDYVKNERKAVERMANQIRIPFLDSVIGYLMSENTMISRSSLRKVGDYFSKFRTDMFNADYELELRIHIIHGLTKHRIRRNVRDRAVLESSVPGEGEYREDAINFLQYDVAELDTSSIEVIDEEICEKIKYAKVSAMMPEFDAMFLDLDDGNFANLGNFMAERVEPLFTNIQNELRTIQKFDKNVSKDFNLSRNSMLPQLERTSAIRRAPGANIRTGLQALNSLLGGKGFESGKVYIMLGVSNRWKSGFLLSCIFWFVMYNTTIECMDRTKKACALYLTLENDGFETTERVVAGMADGEDSTDDTLIMRKEPEELFQEMFDNGFNDENVQVFFKYRYTRSVSAADINGMCRELNEDGFEVRLVVVDYVLRMNSIEKQVDERVRVGTIANELSDNVAKELHVPVVSASQLNKVAQLKVEELAAKGEANAGLNMGNSMVAESFQLIQNVDVVLIGDKEENIDSFGDPLDYYVVKHTKRRGRDTKSLKHFIQPFVKNNGMRLVEDESILPHDVKPQGMWLDKLDSIVQTNDKPQRQVVNQSKPPKRRTNPETIVKAGNTVKKAKAKKLKKPVEAMNTVQPPREI